MLAEIAAREGRLEEAREFLEPARSENPRAHQPRLMLTAYYLKRGENDLALPVAEEAHRLAPEHPLALLYLGQAQFGNGNSEAAVVTLTELTERDPQLPDGYFHLGLAAGATGDVELARQALNKALELNRGYLSAKIALGELALEMGHIEEALERAKQIQEEHPEAGRGYALEAAAYMAGGQDAQAISALEIAQTREPSSASVLRLYRAHRALGNTNAAVAALEQWLSEHRRDFNVRLTLANLMLSEGRNADAIEHYEAIIAEQPENVTALNNLAIVYQGLEPSRALSLAERAYQLAPDNPKVLDTYGWTLIEAGKVESGLARIAKALRQEPDNPEIAYHRAAGLASAGDEETARRELMALLRKDIEFPQRAEVIKLLEELKE